MPDFMIRFFISNLLICLLTVSFLGVKQLLGRVINPRMQYGLWYCFLVLLAAPFLSLIPAGLLKLPGGADFFRSSLDLLPSLQGGADARALMPEGQLLDFAVSVSRNTPAGAGRILFLLWLPGIMVTLAGIVKTQAGFHRIRQSALPLQNPEVCTLYRECLRELKLKKTVPVYSTAFLKSPVITGLFFPRIYVPIHLISDYNSEAMRYMLLHELQHYKHKDAFGNYLMNLAGVLYWFNPFVWFALKEMQNDREAACDTSVLELLDKKEYVAYGNTLISLAEKISLRPFPFTAGMSGGMKQLKRRIRSIASYKPPSFRQKALSAAVFAVISLALFGFAPYLSIRAGQDTDALTTEAFTNVVSVDYGELFGDFDGSFVLYDMQGDIWYIYNRVQAEKRLSPDSTYKIYDALFGLEEGVIAPDASVLPWDGTAYPFAAWNTDQDLASAIGNSVNWYFQSIDSQLGAGSVQDYLQKIGYGNQDSSAGISSYWLEASLKISPLEQTALLVKLYRNEFGFAPANIRAVKDAMLLSQTPDGSLYGKTGTGRVDGKDVNGWFVGYTETEGRVYCFAANIQGNDDATGSRAAEITEDILSRLGLPGRAGS
ncbi:BlaR1 family beta-lactam sensor/signal transducer [Eisenbergiella sp.]